MGFVTVKVRIENPYEPKKGDEVEALIDVGAVYSLIPASLLNKLDIKPVEIGTFTLANNRKVRRKLGEARFVYNGRSRISPVIFGLKQDKPLVGVVTLESLGFR